MWVSDLNYGSKSLFFRDLLPQVTQFHLIFFFERVIPATTLSPADLEQQLENVREPHCRMRSWQCFFEKREWFSCALRLYKHLFAGNLATWKAMWKNVKMRKAINFKTRVSDYVGLSRAGCILSTNLPKLLGNRCTWNRSSRLLCTSKVRHLSAGRAVRNNGSRG